MQENEESKRRQSEQEQRNVAERFSCSSDGLSRGFEKEDHPLEPEIVKSDHGIKAIRVPVIVTPNKRMEQEEPSSNSRAKRHKDSASFSFRVNLQQKLSGVENIMDDKPLDLSKKSNPSTKEAYPLTSEKQHESGKDDIQLLPSSSDLNIEAEFSSPKENTAKKSENEIKASLHSYKVNKIDESIESEDRIRSHAKLKRKTSGDISTNTEAERCKTYNSASSRKTPRLLALLTSKTQHEITSDHNETATDDYMSSMPSTSAGEGCSYDTSVNQEPSTSKNRVSSFICKDCDKGFSSPSKFQTHIRTHTGQKPFICVYCEKTFTQKGNLENHTLRLHNQERPYNCDMCEKSFSIKYDLTLHIRKHTGERPFECEYCETKFTRKDTLNVHITRFHKDVRRYSCDICKMSFPIRNDLRQHSRSHTEERPFKCEICGKAYKRKENLKKHETSHKGKSKEI